MSKDESKQEFYIRCADGSLKKISHEEGKAIQTLEEKNRDLEKALEESKGKTEAIFYIIGAVLWIVGLAWSLNNDHNLIAILIFFSPFLIILWIMERNK